MTIKRLPAAAADNNRQLDDMANCLILLSQIATEGDAAVLGRSAATSTTVGGGGDRLFECKTCDKKFSSFQALGGHRASHTKQPPKLLLAPAAAADLATKPNNKTHECAICGLEFAMGQALGGHMRRHRAALSLLPAAATMKKSSSSSSPAAVSHGKMICLDLDLNLTPLENYDLKLQLGNALQIA